jgi:tetratricopeptide (TPR) repeat protein
MSLPISFVVILSDRDAVISTIRSELKKVGIDHSSIMVTEMPVDAKNKLAEEENPLLIADWEMDSNRVILLFQSQMFTHTHEQLPIYLLARDADTSILKTAQEFGILKVKTGELTPMEIKNDLKEIFDEIATTTPVKETLSLIADAKQLDKFDVALETIENSDEATQQNEAIVIEKASCLMRLNRWADAAGILSALLEGHEDANPRAIHMYGRCLLKTGDLDGATGQLRKANALNPYNSTRLVDLGNALLQLGETDEASESFDSAVTIDPSNANAKKGQGKVKLMQGHINDALAILNDVAGNHEIAAVFNSAAIISIKQNRHGDGLKLYEAAIKALGKDEKVAAKLYFNMGIGFMHSKNAPSAHKCFKKAVELAPDYEDAKHNLEVLEGKRAPKGKKPPPEPELDQTNILGNREPESVAIIGEQPPPMDEITETKESDFIGDTTDALSLGTIGDDDDDDDDEDNDEMIDLDDL